MAARILAWPALLLLFASGCGAESDKFKQARPETVPVEGVVTYKGSPVKGATVVFSPLAAGVAATVMPDSAGRFWPMAFPPDRGVVPGSYDVTVTKVEATVDVDVRELSHDAPPPKHSKPKS